MAHVLRLFVLVVLFLASISVDAATYTTQKQEFRLAQNQEKVIAKPGLPAAKNLEVHAKCDRMDAGAPHAVFNWTVAEDYKGRQRVEITPYRTGFTSGNAKTIRDVEEGQNALEWGGGEAGINYYWRVLTRVPDGWVASETARYEVPTCPVDFEKPKQNLR